MASNMQPSGLPQPPMMGSSTLQQNLGPPMPMQFRPLAPPQQPQFMQPAGWQFPPVGQPMPGMPGQMPHFPQPGQHLPHPGLPSPQAVPMPYLQARPMLPAPLQPQQPAYPGGYLPAMGASILHVSTNSISSSCNATLGYSSRPECASCDSSSAAWASASVSSAHCAFSQLI